MNRGFALVPILGTLAGLAQPAIQWQACLGGGADEQFERIHVMPTGGYAAVGWTSSSDGDVSGQHGERDLWVVRIDDAGQLLWQRTLGGSARDQGFDLLPLSDGGMVVVGQTASNDGDVPLQQGDEDLWLLRLDAAGNVLWNHTYGGTQKDNGHAVIDAGNGELMVAGRTRSNDGDVSGNHGDWDFLLMRISAAGQLIGSWCYGGTDAERANTIVRSSSADYIVGGYASSNNGDVSGTNGDLDVWVIDVDGSGALQWETSWGGTNMESTQGIALALDGGILVPAWSLSFDVDNTCQLGTGDWWLSRLDPTGVISWHACIGGTAEEIPYAVVPLADTGFVVAGQTLSDDIDVQSHIAWQDAWLVRFDGAGNILWERCVGGSQQDEFRGLKRTPDGSFIACGWTGSNDVNVSGNHGAWDAWVVKFGADALGLSVAASPLGTVISDDLSGNVSIQLPLTRSKVRLRVHDAAGRIVHSTVFSGAQHRLSLGTMAPGLYVLQLEADGQMDRHRFIRH